MDSTRGRGCLFYGAHQIAQLLINSQITFPQQKNFKLNGGKKKRDNEMFKRECINRIYMAYICSIMHVYMQYIVHSICAIYNQSFPPSQAH